MYVADADECNFGTDSCTYDCINTPGSYTCACFDGYQLAADSLVCEGEVARNISDFYLIIFIHMFVS